MNDDKKQISFDDAVKLLPDGDTVHTFRQTDFAILGADHKRETLLDAMRKAQDIDVTGEQAQAMNHGLAIHDEHGWLFIATRPDAKGL